jgi:hypothetical protein
MCRKLLFISIVIVAVSSVTLAQYIPGCMQSSSICGAGATFSGHSGELGFSNDTSFQTGQDIQMDQCGPCGGTWMSTTNNGFIDQGTAAFGCGGCREACQGMIGGGAQTQQTGYVPSTNGVTCYPYSYQSQVIGGLGGQAVFNTCGNGAAIASQAGGASESQNITTPATSGSQYQFISGTQGGMAYGVPTSFSSAGGAIAGGGTQSQTFGGITAP